MSVICQMRILKAQRKGDELVEQFRNHDFSNWPDDSKGGAYLPRGTAAYFERSGSDLAELAKRDLEEVLAYAVTLPSHEVVKCRIASYLERL